MADFSAKDVQALRKASGAGMMDAKKALVENDGDMEAATQWLREKGLAKAAGRSDRENTQGAVAVAHEGNVASIAQLKSETDFVAKSPDFTALLHDLAQLALTEGESAADSLKDRVDELKVTSKENIEVGEIVRFEAADGNVLDTYLHVQSERGVNAVLVELSGGSDELAHDIAQHVAFSRPPYLTRDDVPEAEVAAERQSLEAEVKASGKPEQAWPKITEGKLTAWYAQRVLVDQKFVKDEKQTISSILGDATIVRFAQVLIEG